MKFETAADAERYLNGSYVKYKNDPVKVLKVERDFRQIYCYVYNINTHLQIKVRIEKLDFTPLKLGYAFDERNKSSVYVERLPSRNWRQGLSKHNCTARGTPDFSLPGVGEFLSNILNDKYDSLNVAIKKAKKLKAVVPFHSTAAIDQYRRVFYKTRLVGEWVDNHFSLLSQFSYLEGVFNELEKEIKGL